MFNVPVRQAKAYQMQAVMISRYGLFREDVRDLCQLNTSKVQSYLIVNTLKLGFIINIFFNFDRTDTDREEADFEEVQIDTIMTMLLLTGAFWLLTSIWFSMYGLVVAQSLTTKVLVRVARIPLPSAEEIMEVAPETHTFERSVGEAFRVPLMTTRTENESDEMAARSGMTQGVGRVRTSPGSSRSPQPRCASRTFTPTTTGGQGAGQPVPTSRAGADMQPITITELLCDQADVDEEEAAERKGMEPHLKLLMLLKASWEPFDFYSKVSMSLGSATMLSGLGYYGLYYLRQRSTVFDVEAGGWCCFLFMSALAWTSLVLELSITRAQQAFVACSMMAGPTIMLVGYDRNRMHWQLPGILSLTCFWVLLVCWSAVSKGDSWPRCWGASLWLNVLHGESGPRVAAEDLSGRQEEDNVATTRQNTLTRSGTNSSDGSLVSLASSDLGGQRSPHAHLFATMLIACLDDLLEWPLRKSVQLKVRKERDNLYEAAQAVGAFSRQESRRRRRQRRGLEGFWLELPGERAGTKALLKDWMDPDGIGNPRDAQEVTLEDLLTGAINLADLLYQEAITWSMRDMQDLAGYGGEPVLGIRSFTAQFRREGTAARNNIGQQAFRFYFLGVVIVTSMWMFALMLSFGAALQRPSATMVLHSGFTTYAKLPLPWLVPAGYGCDISALDVVMTDTAAGCYIASWNHTTGTTSYWAGPYAVCGDGPTLAADLGPNDQTWALCESGIRSFSVDALTGALRTSPSAGLAGLEKFALDSVENTSASVVGLGLRNGSVLGLRLDMSQFAEGRWFILGSFNAPASVKWKQLALRNGTGLLLDQKDRLWKVDVVTGEWNGPQMLPKGYTWLGLCVRPGESNLMAWGVQDKHCVAPSKVELMYFEWSGFPPLSGLARHRRLT